MDVYGLTGGIGSGKSAVADLLEEYGIPVVSADEMSRIVVAPGSEGLADVVEEFGPEVLNPRGELDRSKMASIVFSDPDRRRRLEAILHPRIRERYEQVLDALEKAGQLVVVYEVPLLFEKSLQGDMKGVILVTADESARIHRVCARDDVTESQVRARMAAQMDEGEKRRRADYVLENDGDLDDLRREVEFLLSRYLRVGNASVRAPIDRAAEPGSPSPIERDSSSPIRGIDDDDEVPSRIPTQIPNRPAPPPATAKRQGSSQSGAIAPRPPMPAEAAQGQVRPPPPPADGRPRAPASEPRLPPPPSKAKPPPPPLAGGASTKNHDGDG